MTDGATVCTTHFRFVPCRKKDGCVLSDAENDVRMVDRYQRGDDIAILPIVLRNLATAGETRYAGCWKSHLHCAARVAADRIEELTRLLW